GLAARPTRTMCSKNPGDRCRPGCPGPLPGAAFGAARLRGGARGHHRHRRSRHPRSAAMGHVFGYTCANDVSVRDVQRRHGGQWFKGKNFDTHLPTGPWIVTADGLDPGDLSIRSRVNGVTKLDSQTKYKVLKILRHT